MAVSVVAKFIADEWFKIMAILCFVVLVVSMTVDLKVDNALVGLFSLSGLLWGIGEMACRPFVSGIAPHPYQLGSIHISGRPRRVNKTGIFLFLLAILIAILGCLKAYPLVVSVIVAI
ncbi:hypothetical protein [Pseudomonas piscis]|uniref:Uncharacterized protein n=1 Tax=Pseudomonas piscis TaxID=2614538 RepID=A0A7X1PK89_9PSED|nr:hypothetical protein [Pseudomonas piscis]MQA53706.1 hypothetical protein [Pseudomonas piscis]